MADARRSDIVEALFAELLGPGTRGHALQAVAPKGIPTAPPPSFPSDEETRYAFVDEVTGEEVLTRDTPTRRYGVGVLYPRQQLVVDPVLGDADDAPEGQDGEGAPAVADDGAGGGGIGEADGDDFDLTTTTQYRPSSMAVTFLAALEPGDKIRVNVSGGRYEKLKVRVGAKERQWWVRRNIAWGADIEPPFQPGGSSVELPRADTGLSLSMRCMARHHEENWLLTYALVNDAGDGSDADTQALFQAQFTVQVIRAGEPAAAFLPYPDRKSQVLLEKDPEARSLDLLYRFAPTFAIGHGCAATWPERWGAERSRKVTADPLPTFEAPSVTPDVTLDGGRVRLAVPMAPLAGLDQTNDGTSSLRAMVDAYGAWISDREDEATALSGTRRDAAEDHLNKCRRAHQRMADGLEWVERDPLARRAFMLANRAVLYQQLQPKGAEREASVDKSGKVVIDPAPPPRDWSDANPSWRAFQIGFLLSVIKSAVLPGDDDRETVELIFFPTGGGKTEAYQGLAAFSLFYRRLAGVDTGVDVILRYTLRLLTSQQFLRAAGLVCAMEIIRDEEGIQGPPFSIGIWVGESTSPATRDVARAALRKLEKGEGDNPFLILRCPWCSAQMGPVRVAQGAPKAAPKVVGYKDSAGTVRFYCPDKTCRFKSWIPAYVIDEDVYEHRPSILIGTIDKFAMLAYRPTARRIFGLGRDGQQECAPPNLIIQDELHLIAGPLGSVAGLYEGVIEALCTDSHDGSPVRPKIIASTATIRKFPEQVAGLYDRQSVALFPSHGLDAADSFFAQFARDADTGELLQGRLYVGVHAPGLGSMQTTQVRAASAALQAARDLPEGDRDPWWTLMMFFNSLRELGTSVTLFQADIRDYLSAIMNRAGRPFAEKRWLNVTEELTARLRQDKIPAALAKLERTSSSPNAVDACLASSIIEVGVDVGRLSLLMVVGQPKSTSQYIQVTGRVGRQWWERPGLVVMLYGASKPRDRSHFERFQSYHQRLYAEVEPVSVTPFASPVVSRAAHAALVAYVRQFGKQSLEPAEVPEDLFEQAARLLIDRASHVDPEELPRLKAALIKRHTEWDAWRPEKWVVPANGESSALMRRAGEWVPPAVRRMTWSVPMSMRDVDAECRGAITPHFAVEKADVGEDEEN